MKFRKIDKRLSLLLIEKNNEDSLTQALII